MTDLKQYRCNGFRPLMAESFLDAGEKLAVLHARRAWGICHAKIGASRVDCYSRDHKTAQVEVFVGRRPRHKTHIEGRNVRFTIHSV